MVESEASILDSQGLLEKSPPSLGGKSLSELLRDGTVRIDVDPKYPQAVGISTIVERVSIFGNAEWEILHNDDPNSPFFTSDFPVAIESTNRPRVQSKLTTARCLRLPASGVHGPVRVARRPPLRAAEAGAAFATPTIVHFGATLQRRRRPPRH